MVSSGQSSELEKQDSGPISAINLGYHSAFLDSVFSSIIVMANIYWELISCYGKSCLHIISNFLCNDSMRERTAPSLLYTFEFIQFILLEVTCPRLQN